MKSCVKEEAGALPCSWRNIGPDMYGYIIETVCDRTRQDVIYARSDVGGLCKSLDAGETWALVNNGLAPSMEDQSPSGVFPGKWGYYWHIYDGRYGLSALAQNPFDDRMFLASTGCVFRRDKPGDGARFGELFLSTDACETWKPLPHDLVIDGTGDSRVHGQMIVCDPEIKGRVYIGTTCDGVFISDDFGVTVRYLALRGKAINDLRLLEGPSGFLLAAACRNAQTYWGLRSEGGIHLLDPNSGRIVNSGLKNRSVRMLAAAGETIYAACERDGIWRSRDFGTTWEESSSGLPDKTKETDHWGYYYGWNSIAMDPRNPGRLLTSTLNVLGISDDGGNSWKTRSPSRETVDTCGMDVGWEEFMAATASIVFDPHQADRVYLTDFHGVWRSDDGGTHWKVCQKGLVNTCIKRVYPLRNTKKASRIAVAQTDGGVQMSDDGVTKLHRVLGFKNAGVYCPSDVKPEELTQYSAACSSFAQRLDRPEIIYAAQNQAQHGGGGTAVIIRSDDGGATWKPLPCRGMPVRPRWIKDIVIDPFRPGTLCAALGCSFDDGGGFYVSEDEGVSWTRRACDFVRGWDFYSQCDANMERSLIADPDHEGIYYTAGRLGGIFRTADRGESWEDITFNLPLNACHGVGTILLDPQTGRLWAGLYDKGLWKLEDARWRHIDTGPYRSAKTLCVNTEGIMLAGFISNWFSPSRPGILVSADSGNSWRPIALDKHATTMYSNIEWDHYVKGRFYAATIGNGVFTAQAEY
ncbi:MAG: hypothetical protein WAX69_13870 [Victivallales bacterium]